MGSSDLRLKAPLTDSCTATNNPIIQSPVGKLLELLGHVEVKRLGGPQIARQHGLGPGKDAACLRPGRQRKAPRPSINSAHRPETHPSFREILASMQFERRDQGGKYDNSCTNSYRMRHRIDRRRSHPRDRIAHRTINSTPTNRGGDEALARHADNPDPLVGIEVPSDLAARQIGLRMHEACRGIAELRRHAHHRARVVTRAAPRFDYGRSRANEHQRRQHHQPRIYLTARPTVVGFAAVAFAIVPGRGFKTVI